jgi:hypothetical protein
MSHKLTSWPKGALAMLAAHAITLAIFFAIIRCAITAGIGLSHYAGVWTFIEDDDDNFVVYWAAVLGVGACAGLLAANVAVKLLTRKAVA